MKTVTVKKTRIMYYHSIKKVFLLSLLAILIYSCTNDDNQVPTAEEPTVAITEISQDIKDLIHFQGDEKAPTVVINVPGGPSTEFNRDITDLIYAATKTEDLLILNVHQSQTLDSTIVKGNDITLDQAIAFNNQSIANLDKVVSYFKNQGRTVNILGFSFGAFVTQDLIAKKGIDSADKYLLMTGRLDINDVLWQASAEGKEGYFENGVTPVINEDPDPKVQERNLLRMSAGLGMNRYTELLDPIDDFSNVTYVYGKTDEAVGSLTTEEVQFLEAKNTTIIVGNGGHGDTIFDFIEQGFMDTFGIEIVL